MAWPAGIIASAPNRSSDARVCIDSTTPIANPELAMRGTERQPISYICRASSPPSYGGRTTSRSARPQKIA